MALVMLAGACARQTLPPLPPPADTAKKARSLTPEQLKLLEIEAGDYRLGAGDIIQLYAMDVVELNRRYVIGPDGKITIPGIGVLDLNGLTRDQAAARIEQLLKTAYLNPKVNIIVEEYNNNRVFVLGEVRWPGQYNFPGRPLLLSAIARAQGLTDKADMRGCTVLRGKGTIIEIDLYDLLRKGDRTLNIPLMPEDTVYVKADEEHTFYVLGEVNRPGVFPRGQEMDVVRAVALAGGQTMDGAMNRVRVVRRVNGKAYMQEINVMQVLRGRETGGPPIEAGDIVFVPRKGVAVFNYYVAQMTPSMNTVLLGATMYQIGRNK